MARSPAELRAAALNALFNLPPDVRAMVDRTSVIVHLIEGDTHMLGLPGSQPPDGHPPLPELTTDEKVRLCFYTAQFVMCASMTRFLAALIRQLKVHPPLKRNHGNLVILNGYLATANKVRQRHEAATAPQFEFDDVFFELDTRDLEELRSMHEKIRVDYVSAVSEINQTQAIKVKWLGREIIILGLAIAAVLAQLHFCSCGPNWRLNIFAAPALEPLKK